MNLLDDLRRNSRECAGPLPLRIAGCALPPRRLSSAGSTMHFFPFSQAQSDWEAFAESHPSATLYHRTRWIELLRRAYGFSFSVASIERGGSTAAACILAHSLNPFSRRLISLPFADLCPPLGASGDARHVLMSALTTRGKRRRCVEIRGIAAPRPWRTSLHFHHWTLNLQRQWKAVEMQTDRDFRRNARRAKENGVRLERGVAPEHVARFFELQLETRKRLGLPPQPRRFFDLVAEIFGPARELDIWLASHGGRDVAAVLLLKDRNVLHAKWSARAPLCPDGASHLLFLSLAEEYAGRFRELDLGRTDIRNQGLIRFKRGLGAIASPLPYSYFPRLPGNASAERLGGVSRAISQAWKRLPNPLARAVGGMIYRFLA